MTRFDTMPAMLHRFDKIARRMALNAKTPAELKRWQKKVAAKLRELTGYDTMRRGPLGAKITEEVPMDGCVRQRVEIHTEPDVVMPMYVLIPQGKGPFPTNFHLLHLSADGLVVQPDHAGDGAGKEAADQLNGNTDRGQEGIMIDPQGRPECGLGHDRSGSQGI